MRFSTVSVAILAGVVAAVPQVQPISQISDGQIQAPTATATPVVPEVSSVAYTGSAPAAVSVPAEVTTAPVATATPIVPTSLVTPIVGGNSTVPSGTGAVGSSSSATGPSGSATSSGSVPEQSTGAAAGTAVSFGGLVFAIAAAVFA